MPKQISVHTLDGLLLELEAQIPFFDLLQTSVSGGTVGWHIEHSLLTVELVIDQLAASKPHLYKWRFNWIRFMILTKRKIPRGRAKSPKIVLPKNHLDIDSLGGHLLAVRAKMDVLKNLPKDRFFDHPYFGHLTLKQTIRFLEIHTRHHLAIIKDILIAAT